MEYFKSLLGLPRKDGVVSNQLEKYVIFLFCVLHRQEENIPVEIIKNIIYLVFPQIHSGFLSLNTFETLACWVSNTAWKQQWKIIYQATKDGFSSGSFHRHCNGISPTYVLIVSHENFIFGGYTVCTWEGNAWKKSDGGFIFTISNPHGIPMTKYDVINHNGIFCSPGYGPIFGEGNDIYVASNSNIGSGNYSRTFFPGSYCDTTGKGNVTFTGSDFFKSKEIIVFHLVPD